MTTFVLIPGAGGAGHWYWRLVAENLEGAGHTARAVDLPGADPSAGLPEYADLVVAAAEGSDKIVLVAQSMGAFTALGACDRLAPARLVLLNAMIPAPGETADAWWDNTGWEGDRGAGTPPGGGPPGGRRPAPVATPRPSTWTPTSCTMSRRPRSAPASTATTTRP